MEMSGLDLWSILVTCGSGQNHSISELSYVNQDNGNESCNK